MIHLSDQLNDRAPITEESLQALVDSIVKEGAVPGIGVALSHKKNRIECYAGKSDLEAHTDMTHLGRFEISCMMKLFVALISIKMAAAGQMGLSAPIGTYLTDLHIRAPSKTTAICVSHLLSHSSGYRGLNIQEARVKWGFSWKKMMEYFESTEQLFFPGQYFNYEHSEHALLGEIIGRISGVSPTELVQREIFSPLELRWATTKHSDVVKSYIAKGGQFINVGITPPGTFWSASLPDVAMTLGEILSVGEALLSPPRLSLPDQVMSQLSVPFIALKRAFRMRGAEQLPIHFGLGGACYSDGIIGHNGSTMGQSCALRIIQEEELSIVIGMNVWSPQVRDVLFDFVIRSLTDARYPKGPPASHDSGYDNLFQGNDPRKFAGSYIGSYHGTLNVTAGDDGSVRISSPTNKGHVPLFELKRKTEEQVTIKAPTPMSVAFFADPVDGAACLAWGSYTYKRIRC